MGTPTPIQPLADDVYFSDRQLMEAAAIAHSDPGRLSDFQLSMLACYSADDAATAARKREAALRVKAAAPTPRVTVAAPVDPPVREGTSSESDQGGGVATFFITADATRWPLTWKNMGQVHLRFFERIGQILAKDFAKRDVQLDELSVLYRSLAARVEAVEARGDSGVYDEAKTYTRWSGVTFDGSFWLAQRDVRRGERPGSSTAWRLAVRRGKPGRDGKDLRA